MGVVLPWDIEFDVCRLIESAKTIEEAKLIRDKDIAEVFRVASDKITLFSSCRRIN